MSFSPNSGTSSAAGTTRHLRLVDPGEELMAQALPVLPQALSQVRLVDLAGVSLVGADPATARPTTHPHPNPGNGSAPSPQVAGLLVGYLVLAPAGVPPAELFSPAVRIAGSTPLPDTAEAGPTTPCTAPPRPRKSAADLAGRGPERSEATPPDPGSSDPGRPEPGPSQPASSVPRRPVEPLSTPSPGPAGARPPADPGGLRIDRERRTVEAGGHRLDLTFLEFELLAHLMAHPHRVHSREQLVASVWGYGHVGDGRTVDVHIARIRGKLGPEQRKSIVTVRRVGYSYVPTDG